VAIVPVEHITDLESTDPKHALSSAFVFKDFPQGPISALCFGHEVEPTMLAIATPHGITIAYLKVTSGVDFVIKRKHNRMQCDSSFQTAHHLAFSTDSKCLLACEQDVIEVYDAQNGALEARLEGHLGLVSMAYFFPNTSSRIISLGDDRGFKIWDLVQKQCLYESGIISAKPLTAVAMDGPRNRLVVGSEEGKLWFYQFCDEEKFSVRLLNSVNMSQFIQQPTCDDSLSDSRTTPVISSVPLWKKDYKEFAPNEQEDSDTKNGGLSNTSLSIIGLHHISLQTMPEMAGTKSDRPLNGIPNMLLQKSSTLLVGMAGHVVIMDTDNFNILLQHSFSEDYVEIDNYECHKGDQLKGALIPFAGSYHYSNTSYPQVGLVSIGSAFNGELTVLVVRKVANKENDIKMCQANDTSQLELVYELSGIIGTLTLNDTIEQTIKKAIGLGEQRSLKDASDLWARNIVADVTQRLAQLGVYSTKDLTQRRASELIQNVPARVLSVLDSFYDQRDVKDEDASPLFLSNSLTLKKATKATKLPGKDKEKARAKSKNVLNKPVTFKSNVKSSGYMQAPNVGSIHSRKKQSKKKSPTSDGQQEGPMRLDLENHPSMNSTRVDAFAPISKLRYSFDGKWVGICTTDRVARGIRLRKEPQYKDFIGHNGACLSVEWSLRNEFLLTSSSDCTSILWSVDKSEKMLTFNSVQYTPPSKSLQGSIREGVPRRQVPSTPFPYEIKSSKFYYKDKYIMLCCKNQLYMFEYHCDKVDPTSITPRLNNNHYHLTHSFRTTKAHFINTFACINSFLSNLLILGTSDKSIEVVDIGTGKCVRQLHTNYTRGIQSVEVADYGSPSTSFDVFLSSSPNNGITLWDLRSSSSVRTFMGHHHRFSHIGSALSPCGRFILTGSEDQHGYVFDIGSGNIIDRYKGTGDVVTDVGWNPCRPEFALSSTTGHLSLFGL
jgi:WD40 repeat protein